MERVSGLTSTGRIRARMRSFEALSASSPKPLNDFQTLLDFGAGAGRLARLFKGFRGHMLAQTRTVGMGGRAPALGEVVPTTPRQPLPLDDGQFDGVISASVFTHMNEADCKSTWAN